MPTVVFVVPAAVHLLDLAGPAQVFATADDLGVPHDLRYVAEQTHVESHQGLPLAAETAWPELTGADLVVVCGHRVGGASADGADGALGALGALGAPTLERLVAHHARGGRVASICAGAFSLAAAGLLDGRRATTHHALQDDLARRYPRTTVVRDVLFVDEGTIATSAGIASGIDLALHLLAVDHGPALAARVARALVVPARRGGDAAQVSAMLRHRDHLVDAVHRAQDILDAEFDRTLPLAELARRVGLSERTLTRRFREATATTPLRYQQALRLEHAEGLLAHGATAESAAHAVGLADARMLRRLRAGR